MDLIRITDNVSSFYPILDIITINGVEIKHLLNLDQVYRPLKKLGKGAYGTVTCYREIATNNIYAFKEIEITDHTNIKVLQDEVTILAKLSENNSSIVKYRDSFVYTRFGQNIYVIVTEFISGFTLHDYINSLIVENTVASPETVLNLAIWLFSLIAELHTSGYVHRDIKPENIMVDQVNNRFVLIDFGLTCSLKRTSENKIKHQRVVGTPEFIAPELWVLKRKSKFSFRSTDLMILKKADLWACGITLYCILEKKYPWIYDNLYTLGQQIVGPYPIEFKYPHADLINFISLILNRDINIRPSAIDIVKYLKEYFPRENIPSTSSLSLVQSELTETDSTDSRRVTFNSILELRSDNDNKLHLSSKINEESIPHVPRLKLTRLDSEESIELNSSRNSTDNPRTFINKSSPHSKEGIISSRGGTPPSSPRNNVEKSSPSTSPRKDQNKNVTPPTSPMKKASFSPRNELFTSIFKRFQN